MWHRGSVNGNHGLWHGLWSGSVAPFARFGFRLPTSDFREIECGGGMNILDTDPGQRVTVST